MNINIHIDINMNTDIPPPPTHTLDWTPLGQVKMFRRNLENYSGVCRRPEPSILQSQRTLAAMKNMPWAPFHPLTWQDWLTILITNWLRLLGKQKLTHTAEGWSSPLLSLLCHLASDYASNRSSIRQEKVNKRDLAVLPARTELCNENILELIREGW